MTTEPRTPNDCPLRHPPFTRGRPARRPLRRAALPVLATLWLAAGGAAAATFTVDSAGDGADLVIGDGVCSAGTGCTLRAAILEANATPAADTIEFALPAGAVIAPAGALPVLAAPVVVDGSTQPGWSAGAPVVVLDGAAAGAANGLVVAAAGSGSTLRGLVIERFGGSGVVLAGSDSVLEGSWIRDNAVEGVGVTGGGNRIGGVGPAARNVISGNSSDGIQIFGTGAVGNVVEGSYIGTDPTGAAADANGSTGILVLAAGNRIGGTPAGAGNVISGNPIGIQIREPGSSGNVVEGNRIGLAADGLSPLGNSNIGVMISSAPDNRVGGVDLGARNVISANPGIGVFVTGAQATGNAVEGNFIGTDVDGAGSGATAAGSAGAFGNGTGVQVNAPGNAVGGSDPRAGNVIVASAFAGVYLNGFGGSVVEGNRIGVGVGGLAPQANGTYGVLLLNGSSDNLVRGNEIAWNLADGILADSGAGNSWLSNSLHDNQELGVELGVDGVTANDPGDADAGPNELQNFPVLSAARGSGADGALESAPGASFTVQLFASDACDDSGHGEGRTLVGESVVQTDASGSATFTVSFSPTAAPGQWITATATDAGGNSSELSACLLIEGLEVAIDIKPGSYPNSINLGSHGAVPVAIFSSPEFDATTVDPATVTLASAPVKLRGRGTPQASEQDVDGDGLTDLVVHVETEALDLDENDTEAVLEGRTTDGLEFRGVDSIRVVP